MKVKHGGCKNCGTTEQEILASAFIEAGSELAVGQDEKQLANAALCATCLPLAKAPEAAP